MSDLGNIVAGGGAGAGNGGGGDIPISASVFLWGRNTVPADLPYIPGGLLLIVYSEAASGIPTDLAFIVTVNRGSYTGILTVTWDHSPEYTEITADTEIAATDTQAFGRFQFDRSTPGSYDVRVTVTTADLSQSIVHSLTWTITP